MTIIQVLFLVFTLLHEPVMNKEDSQYRLEQLQEVYDHNSYLQSKLLLQIKREEDPDIKVTLKNVYLEREIKLKETKQSIEGIKQQ